MKFVGPLIIVDDVDKSKDFYVGIMKQEIKYDFGANKIFKSGLCLQSKESIQKVYNLRADMIAEKNNKSILYFENDDFTSFVGFIEEADSIEYLNHVMEHSWGQRSVCFYDPDGHIIDVSESMECVFKRLFLSGMNLEEISKKTQHPLEFIKSVCASFL